MNKKKLVCILILTLAGIPALTGCGHIEIQFVPPATEQVSPTSPAMSTEKATHTATPKPAPFTNTPIHTLTPTVLSTNTPVYTATPRPSLPTNTPTHIPTSIPTVQPTAEVVPEDMPIEASIDGDVYSKSDLADDPHTTFFAASVKSDVAVEKVVVTSPSGENIISLPADNGLWGGEGSFHGGMSGAPQIGGIYTFTAFGVDDTPIAGAVARDVYVGGFEPEPPTNVRAEVVEKGILVTWDPPPVIPGAFDPGGSPPIGNYLVNFVQKEKGGLYGWNSQAIHIVETSHLIPFNSQDFGPGEQGQGLKELEDGVYHLSLHAFSYAPEGTGGDGFEGEASALSEEVRIVIEEGQPRIEKAEFGMQCDVYSNLNGLTDDGAFLYSGAIFNATVLGYDAAEVEVTSPAGETVVLSSYGDVYGKERRFSTGIAELPHSGKPYICTALDANGTPIPGAVASDVYLGDFVPEPPTNIQAEVVENGVLVTWDPSSEIPGAFDPNGSPPIGGYQITLGAYGWNSFSTPLTEASHLIPLRRQDFGSDDLGLPLGEMEDGVYELILMALSFAPEETAGQGVESQVEAESAERIRIVIEGGQPRVEVP